MIGGAALALSSPLSVRGQLSVQALSFASIAMLETSPTFMLAGTFGQPLSTSNMGRLRPCATAVCGNVAPAADRPIATANANFFMALPPRCLKQTCPVCRARATGTPLPVVCRRRKPVILNELFRSLAHVIPLCCHRGLAPARNTHSRPDAARRTADHCLFNSGNRGTGGAMENGLVRNR